jgi:uncharacterized protein YqgC (DUF456 family)
MMETLAHIIGVTLLVLGCLVALCSLVLGVPGTILIVGLALLYAWATGFAAVHWSTIGWLALIAVFGEALELVVSGGGAASARPSRRVTIGALLGALVGGVVGTPFLFGIGSLLGALAGAFIGAAIAVHQEGGTWGDSLTTGFAALKGRLLGFVLKAALAVVMVVVLLAAVI